MPRSTICRFCKQDITPESWINGGFCSKECRSQYVYHPDKHANQQKLRAHHRKLALVESKGGCCVKCGYNKSLRALTFHHRVPEDKKFILNICALRTYSWASILEEADKTDLLCSNCHFELHFDENTASLSYSTKKKRDKKLELLSITGDKCSNCGYNRCPAAISFHHRDPMKKVKQIPLCNSKELESELEKTIPLCANCHNELHAAEVNPPTMEEIQEFRRNYKEKSRRDSVDCGWCGVKTIKGKKFCCHECYSNHKMGSLPKGTTQEQLISEIAESNYSQVALRYGITRHRLKRLINRDHSKDQNFHLD